MGINNLRATIKAMSENKNECSDDESGKSEENRIRSAQTVFTAISQITNDPVRFASIINELTKNGCWPSSDNGNGRKESKNNGKGKKSSNEGKKPSMEKQNEEDVTGTFKEKEGVNGNEDEVAADDTEANKYQKEKEDTDEVIKDLEQSLIPGRDDEQVGPHQDQETNNNKVEHREQPKEVVEAQIQGESLQPRSNENDELKTNNDESPEDADLVVDFFPVEGSNNAKLSEEDTPERQLTIGGLTSCFLNEVDNMSFTKGSMQDQQNEVHLELVKHGFKYIPKKIIGSQGTTRVTKKNQNVSSRVTYINEETKMEVKKAAKKGKMWNLREDKSSVKRTFFMEPNYHTIKRRRTGEDDQTKQTEPEPKRIRPDANQPTKMSRAQRELEENKTREYVHQEMVSEVITQGIREERARSTSAEVSKHYKADGEEVLSEHERDLDPEGANDEKTSRALQDQNRYKQTVLKQHLEQETSSDEEGVSVREDSEEEVVVGTEFEEDVELDDNESNRLKPVFEWEDMQNEQAQPEKNNTNLYGQYFTGRPSRMEEEEEEEERYTPPSPLYIDGQDDVSEDTSNQTDRTKREVILKKNNTRDNTHVAIVSAVLRDLIGDFEPNIVGRDSAQGEDQENERSTTQMNFHVTKRVGNNPIAYRSQDAVLNTPPHIGNVVHEEEIRKTPPIDRLGHSKDERTETQKKFHVIDRVGTNAQAYPRPSTSRDTNERTEVQRKFHPSDRVGNNAQAYMRQDRGENREGRSPRKKKLRRRSKSKSKDKITDNHSKRESLARGAKRPVEYRETSRDRLEAQVKEDSITYVAPKSYHSTTSEYDSVTESDGEEEEKSQRK